MKSSLIRECQLTCIATSRSYLFFFILTTIGALTIANSSFAFEVSRDTTLDRDSNEPFVFTVSGVELDCAGHSINGNGSGNGLTLRNIRHVAVRNCHILAFARGVLLDKTTDSVFEANEVAFSRQDQGFHLQNGSNKNLFARNFVHNNTRDGFDLDFSDGNAFVLNVVDDNSVNGIELDDCSDNDIVANQITFNKHTGVTLDRSARNVIDNNSISANAFYGIHFAMGSTDNLIRYNEVCGNTMPDPMDPTKIILAQILISNNSRRGTQSNQNIFQDVCP
jgi:parallel beta-helix repeat protein